MTDADIAEARRRCDAASPGPWTAQSVPGWSPYAVAPAAVVADADEQSIADCWDNTPADRAPATNEANAAFIVAARTGWPAALDEVERLRPFEADCVWLRAAWDRAILEADQLSVQLAAMTAARDEACVALKGGHHSLCLCPPCALVDKLRTIGKDPR